MAMAHYNEVFRSELKIRLDIQKVEGIRENSGTFAILHMFVFLNLFFTIVQTFVNYKIMLGMKLQYFKRTASWVDLTTMFISIST